MRRRPTKKTQAIEFVQSHGVALCLKRINNAPGYDPMRWKRALYHALLSAGLATRDEIKAIREALNLP